MPKVTAAERPELRLVTRGAGVVDLADFDAVFRRFAPYVATVARRILGDESEVEDLVQEVFVEAHRGLSKIREAQAVRGWLGRICVRRCVRRLRYHRLRRAFSLQAAPDHAHLAAPGATPEQVALVSGVYRLLAEVGTMERVAWVLKVVDGASLDETAQLCGCSKSTVQRRLRAVDVFLRERGIHG